MIKIEDNLHKQNKHKYEKMIGQGNDRAMVCNSRQNNADK
jgi:hypothetical protein